MRLCWYAFQGVACILSPYGAFMEKPPALPGDVYSCCKRRGLFDVYVYPLWNCPGKKIAN